MKPPLKNSAAHVLFLQVAPPVLFAVLAWTRCYLETSVLIDPPFFGYYVGFHHTLWMGTVVLSIILLAHLILRMPVRSLLWLMYGSVVMLIPVAYALASGQQLGMAYLRGTAGRILLHTLTFCLMYEPNLPMAIELMVIFVCMIAVGRLYGCGWLRSIGLAVAVQVGGSLLAVEWLGVGERSAGILRVATRLANHPMWAVVFLYGFSLLVVILLWRGGAFGSDEVPIGRRLAAAMPAWVVAAVVARLTGWFSAWFDCAAVGLLPGSVVFFGMAYFGPGKGTKTTRTVAACSAALVVLQLLVLIPILLHVERELSPFAAGSPAAPWLFGGKLRWDRSNIEQSASDIEIENGKVFG